MTGRLTTGALTTGRARWLALAGLVVVLVVLGDRLGALRGTEAGHAAQSPLVGSAAPALAGGTVDGGHYRLRKGRLTVVNIWASWCGPCRSEMPAVARFAREHPGVRVVTIDTRDGIDPARRFLARMGASGLVAVHDPHGRLAVSWGATGVPETFVVDAHGVVRAHHAGPVDAGWLVQEVGRWRAS